jgi:hypothetical protein
VTRVFWYFLLQHGAVTLVVYDIFWSRSMALGFMSFPEQHGA